MKINYSFLIKNTSNLKFRIQIGEHLVGDIYQWASLMAQTVKNLPAKQDLIPGSRRSPGEGNGYPVQYSYLENSKDRGAWWAIVHGSHKKSDTTELLTLSISSISTFLVSRILVAQVGVTI